MKNIKRKIEFLDADGKRARLDVEITDRNGYPEFTVSGTYLGGGGQVIDHIKPANDEQNDLTILWRIWHLKDISSMPEFSEKVGELLDRIEAMEAEREAAAEVKTGDDAILAKMSEEGIDDGMLEAVKAYISLGIESDDGIADFEESYNGEFSSDEEFAQNLAEELDEIDKDAKWPNNCIDWELAARELMYDYSEADGFYFRNI